MTVALEPLLLKQEADTSAMCWQMFLREEGLFETSLWVVVVVGQAVASWWANGLPGTCTKVIANVEVLVVEKELFGMEWLGVHS